MNRWKVKTATFLSVTALLCLEGCGMIGRGQEETEQESYAELTLFSDVSHWNMPKWSMEEGSVTEAITQETGVKVTFEIPPQDADTQLSQMLLEDKLPDIISVTDDTVIKQLISSGKVWKLDELLKEYCPDSHLLTDFPKDVRTVLENKYGGWYTYPSNIRSEDSQNIWKDQTGYYEELSYYQENTAVMWNREILERSGLSKDDLKTESQVLAALERVKEMDLSIHGKRVIPLLLDGENYQAFSFQYLNNTFGAERIDENGDYEYLWRQPQARESLNFVNTALREGYTKAQYLTYDNEQIRGLIAKDHVLCFIGNVSNTGMDARKWVSTGPIYSDRGDQPVVGIYHSSYEGWMKTLISKNCKNPKDAAAFLDYMTSDRGMLRTNYGMEGVDFYYDEDGLVRRTEVGEQKYQDKRQTGLSMWWNFICNSWEYSILPEPEEGSEEFCSQEIRTALGRESYVYDLSLFEIPDEFWEKNPQEKQIKEAIDAYVKEQILKMITAESEEAFGQQYEAFLKGMQELGVEQMEEKMNEQIQENCRFYGKMIEKINKTS